MTKEGLKEANRLNNDIIALDKMINDYQRRQVKEVPHISVVIDDEYYYFSNELEADVMEWFSKELYSYQKKLENM